MDIYGNMSRYIIQVQFILFPNTYYVAINDINGLIIINIINIYIHIIVQISIILLFI